MPARDVRHLVHHFLGASLLPDVRRLERRDFFFFPPENTQAWQTKNYGCVLFYYPLIIVDGWIVTGKGIGREPLWGLTGGKSERIPQRHKP